MITKFDSLYAGHADLDNVGYGGTPINDRRFSNAHLATALSKAESMAKLMDGLAQLLLDGRASLPARRHGMHSQQSMMALHLAHRTKNPRSLRFQHHAEGTRCGWPRTTR